MVLGVGGKMGPTLARMAKRAAPAQARDRRGALLASPACASALDAAGVETIACRPARPRRASSKPAQGRQRRVHGRPQVRRHRQRAADLGDERAGAGDGRRGLHGLAHRRLLDRLRLSVRAGRQRRRDRGRAAVPPPGDYATSCVGRERMFEYFSARARHAGPPVPAELRDRHALRRAARHRPQGARRRADRSRRWAMST